MQGGVIGAATDDSSVYFVAEGALSGTEANEHGEKAQSGQPNLYVHEGGVTKLIAVLSGEDSPSWGAEPGGELRHMTARVSPNGRWLTFMSQRSLTGYDNRDANSGEPDEEVFIYDADTGHLACASCNPTGARPVGVEYSQIANKLVGGSAVATVDLDRVKHPRLDPIRCDAALYQSRYLANSGRLFFNSNDALIPQDVNGTEDVYEFEPPGVGNCTTSSQSFNTASGGCLSLISSGTSSEESAFLDASEDGGDVFFLTSAPLRPQDVDKGVDVYDAHVCTGEVPCLPEPPETSPPCDTGDSCKAAPTPQPSIFGAPSSQTFSGAGNLAPPPPVKPTTPTQTHQRPEASQSPKGLQAKAKEEAPSLRTQGKSHIRPPQSKEGQQGKEGPHKATSAHTTDTKQSQKGGK